MRMCACRGTAGFAHVSCLAEQAKILMDEAEANNLDWEAKNPRFRRWDTCSLCEQHYYGDVHCALGWGCWKTYVGRAETDQLRGMAMSLLGNGLYEAGYQEDALSVREADLAMMRRIGDCEENVLAVQGNLANSYQIHGRYEEANCLWREAYSGRLKLIGEEHGDTLRSANNYAISLVNLERFEEAKALLRKTLPVAQRALGDDQVTLRLRWVSAKALYMKDGATLDDLREAVTTLEDTVRTARQVLGGVHPLVGSIERDLRNARAKLRARETPSTSA